MQSNFDAGGLCPRYTRIIRQFIEKTARFGVAFFNEQQTVALFCACFGDCRFPQPFSRKTRVSCLCYKATCMPQAFGRKKSCESPCHKDFRTFGKKPQVLSVNLQCQIGTFQTPAEPASSPAPRRSSRNRNRSRPPPPVQPSNPTVSGFGVSRARRGCGRGIAGCLGKFRGSNRCFPELVLLAIYLRAILRELSFAHSKK